MNDQKQELLELYAYYANLLSRLLDATGESKKSDLFSHDELEFLDAMRHFTNYDNARQKEVKAIMERIKNR